MVADEGGYGFLNQKHFGIFCPKKVYLCTRFLNSLHPEYRKFIINHRSNRQIACWNFIIYLSFKLLTI